VSDPNPALTGREAELQAKGVELAVRLFELKGLMRELIEECRRQEINAAFERKVNQIEGVLDAMK
jgi:hypothetical protein